MFPPDDYDPEAGKSKKHVSSSDMQEAGQGQPHFRNESAPAASVFPQQSASHDMAAFDASAPVSGQQMKAGQQSTGDFQAQLESARRYLWGGELDKARQVYEILQTDHPDNPEIASELGNLLMQQNRVQEAGQVYEAAIVNFRRLDRDNEAIGLIRFISRYNPTLADTLYNKNWQ